MSTFQAARRAHKLVTDRKLTWPQLLNSPVLNIQATIAQARAEGREQGYRDGFAAGCLRGRVQAREEAAEEAAEDEWPAFAQFLLDKYGDRLSKWETDFLESWADKGPLSEPSEKQYAVFARLARKFGEKLPNAEY